MSKPTCHCCGVEIYGCTGSLSFPGGIPFVDPEFHCDRCTFRLQLPDPFVAQPCHVQRSLEGAR